ncbi:MAG: SDR family oxidoreductase [Deltaproteobacteria bacterium]|nr:SDR family oxidoreductase [Deltaproteobacteria bacterium]
MQNSDFKKTALVTGGAAGLGREISIALGSKFKVAVHYNSSQSDAESIENEIDECSLFKEDLTYPGAAARLISRVINHFGDLDLLINSAAIFQKDDSSLSELAKMKMINVDAPEKLINAALPHLEKSSGKIINIGDIAGIHPFKEYKAYSKSKTELIKLTQNMALSLAFKKVCINVICPGIISLQDNIKINEAEKLKSKIPLGRFGNPKDVTRTVLFLSASDFITGQIISVDGGRLLNYS